MEIVDFADGADGLRRLLSWPESLSSFQFRGSYYGISSYIDLPLIKDMLLTHKDRLVNLDIAQPPREI